MNPFWSNAFAQIPSRGGNGFSVNAAASSSTTGIVAPSAGGTGLTAPVIDFNDSSAIHSTISTGFGDMTIIELIQMTVVYAFIAAAALSAIFIFVGGINFILSGGNDEKIKTAVNTIRYSIIGLIITILSFTFVTIIGRIFGLNFLDYISYDQIRASINRLVQNNEQSDFGGGSFNP